jgi:hypothetical protein
MSIPEQDSETRKPYAFEKYPDISEPLLIHASTGQLSHLDYNRLLIGIHKAIEALESERNTALNTVDELKIKAQEMEADRDKFAIGFADYCMKKEFFFPVQLIEEYKQTLK